MLDGATKAFVQGYNAQIAVDGDSQVIVAADVTQHAVDSAQFVPMLAMVANNLGQLPQMDTVPETAQPLLRRGSPARMTADAGYFSAANVTALSLAGVALYVPPQRREKNLDTPGGPKHPVAAAMRDKLNTPEGKAIYKRRKAIVEPVFGQVKDARGLRSFLLRGFAKVNAEWRLICLTHNLLKLFRAVNGPAVCPA
jgi:hypothetical protein